MKIAEEILSLIPYKPGKPISETKREFGLSEVIKLASNENPLGVSPKVKEALLQAIENIHRYPDPACYEFLKTVETKWGWRSEQCVVGNGSNELIDLLIRLFCEPKEAILVSDKAFIAYELCAQAARVRTIKAPLAAGYRIDLKLFYDFLDKNKEVKIIFIPNPNNPTGTYVNDQEVRDFLSQLGNKKDYIIVFDEAYNEYTRATDYSSADKYVNQYNNVFVLRTLSKAYGLAGLRIGILYGPSQYVDLIHRIRNPFNVNELAQAAGVAALGDDDFLRRSKENNSKGLDDIYLGLRALGLPVVESQANFVLFDTLRDVSQVNLELLKRGVIMRPLLNYGFRTEMRLSVGLPEENKKALEALKEVIAIIPPLKYESEKNG